jgi:hypothetical protein
MYKLGFHRTGKSGNYLLSDGNICPTSRFFKKERGAIGGRFVILLAPGRRSGTIDLIFVDSSLLTYRSTPSAELTNAKHRPHNQHHCSDHRVRRYSSRNASSPAGIVRAAAQPAALAVRYALIRIAFERFPTKTDRRVYVATKPI